MGTAGDSDEVRQMATAMVALDHSGCQKRWSALNGNVRQMATAMECVEWRRLAAAMKCVE
jgi:hypothetical protein